MEELENNRPDPPKGYRYIRDTELRLFSVNETDGALAWNGRKVKSELPITPFEKLLAVAAVVATLVGQSIGAVKSGFELHDRYRAAHTVPMATASPVAQVLPPTPVAPSLAQISPSPEILRIIGSVGPFVAGSSNAIEATDPLQAHMPPATCGALAAAAQRILSRKSALDLLLLVGSADRRHLKPTLRRSYGSN
jgi:hypothetical protein